MASAVLSAAFVVFLVCERTTKAKHVQMVSGVSALAFWVATYMWDFANFLVPSTAIVAAFAAFDLPYYCGAKNELNTEGVRRRSGGGLCRLRSAILLRCEK
eukprot:6376540-Pyramimonas_sp.AAC.1